MPNTNDYYQYYGDAAPSEGEGLIDRINDLGKKKYLVLLLLILLIATPVFLFVIAPITGFDPLSFLHFSGGNTTGIHVRNADGVEISSSGSVSLDGDVQDTFSNDGPALIHNTSSGGRITITGRIEGLSPGNNAGRITILSKDGTVIATLDEGDFSIDDEGNFVISIDPNDLGFDFNGEENFEGTYEFTFQIEIDNEDTGETVAIQIPAIIIFQEFIGTGCLALTRQSVSETTHYGILELSAKIKVMCETESDLEAYVDWTTERAGPVEVLFSDYGDGTSLVSDALPVKGNISPGEYPIKIYFAPSKKYAGQKSTFKVGFKLDNSEQVINFSVANENLEQCVKVTSDDSIIGADGDKAAVTVSTQGCSSPKINIYFCDGDYGCSGGTDEGQIVLSQGKLVMSPNQVKTITVSRGDMAGLFGVVVEASVPGMEKTFIDEKEITVLPTDELVYPEKFGVSLLGSSKDFVYVHNKSLAEDVSLNAGICDVYSSYMGTTSTGMPLLGYTAGSGDSWLYNLYYATTAGTGLYESTIMDNLSPIYTSMVTTKSSSYQENLKIKNAYIDVKEMVGDIEDVQALVSQAVDDAKDLQDAMSGINDYADFEVTGQIVSLVATVTSLATTSAALCIRVNSAATQSASVATSTSSCTPAKSSAELTTAALEEAAGTQCEFSATHIPAIVVEINTLYSLYNQIDTATKDDEDLSADSAVEYSQTALSKMNDALDAMNDAEGYIDLALKAAAIDSTSSASFDDAQAKMYLQLALGKQKEVEDLIGEVRANMVEADDSVTTLLTDDLSNTELIVMATSALITILDMAFTAETSTTVVQGELSAASSSNSSAVAAATLATSCCGCSWVGCCDLCASCTAAIAPLKGVGSNISTLMGATSGQRTLFGTVISGASQLSTIFDLYQSLSSDYSSELTAARTRFTEVVGDIDGIRLDASTAVTDLGTAITAAQTLSTDEVKSSNASTYESDSFVSGNFNRKRLNGILGSFVSGAFIAGAKEGGVYSDSLNTTSTDCSNRVTMTLPDFVINLYNDAKTPTVTVNDVIPQWTFTDAKLFDVFEEQEVGITFSDGGLKENKYGVLELKVDKHKHDQPTTVVGTFGPFNIQDSALEELSYKYHMKFNATERKSASPNTSAICEKGLLFGQTGDGALPKIVVGWDWNSVSSQVAKENYLDATQLSILLSKKISVLDEFLSKAGTSCPTNYTYEVLKNILPMDTNVASPTDCYLPLNTYYYDGKPALYYYLNNIASSSSEYYDDFFGEPLISNADEMLEIIDFNTYLVWDGYGTDFQSDFSSEYKNTLFKSDVTFLDPDFGAYKYFGYPSKAFYSSPAVGLASAQEFVLPDAGKYRVRMLITFNSTTPRIYSGGNTAAKIIFELTLLEPVNKDYSPFFYTPIDDGVGTNVNNNRHYYGTGLSSGESFPVQKSDGIYIRADQTKALEQVKVTNVGNFFWLNSLASRRAKLLDYSYSYYGDRKMIFSPTIATPLLMEIVGVQGTLPYIQYTIKKEQQVINASSNSLLLVNGLENCKDFYGGELDSLVSNLPDYKLGNDYGLVFAQAENSGKVYLKTVAYSSVDDAYGLAYNEESGSVIVTPNTSNSEGTLIYLQGIKGMSYNYIPDAAKIQDLTSLFSAVNNGSVCVSKLGNREIYWWPEEYLYEKETPEGTSLDDLASEAKANCIR